MSDTKNLINVIIFYAKITKHEFEISNIFSYFGQWNWKIICINLWDYIMKIISHCYFPNNIGLEKKRLNHNKSKNIGVIFIIYETENTK
jgi:hypothetical protein